MQYIIPEGMTKIDNDWVSQNISNNVTEVICPDTLKVIGADAFCDTNIRSIILSSTLEHIESCAFYSTNIESLVSPSTLEKIDYSAFRYCNNLEEVVVYRQLYDDCRLWVRPLDDFMSEVDHVKYPEVKEKYRFELQKIKKK